MDFTHLAQTVAIYALPVLFAITLHEAAHGYVARHFGDMTAYAQGRISLNPARHIDLVGTILVFGLVLLDADVPKLTALLSKSDTDIETLRVATRGLAFALLVGATAYLPLLMLLWFAPLLVVFGGLAPLSAMKLSFAACFKNTLPFLVYSAAILALWFAISLPAAFGTAGMVVVAALLVASIPVLFCSIYASYKDIFR